MAVNDLKAPFFGAGFYYTTFMWPAKFREKVYAGGRTDTRPALVARPDDAGFPTCHAGCRYLGAGCVRKCRLNHRSDRCLGNPGDLRPRNPLGTGATLLARSVPGRLPGRRLRTRRDGKYGPIILRTGDETFLLISWRSSTDSFLEVVETACGFTAEPV